MIEIGTSIEIRSEILEENRTILLGLPCGYADTDQSYPLLVVLDGGHVPYVSLYEGLRWVFAGWQMPDSTLLAGGLTELAGHYAGLSDEYGFTVPVPAGKYMTLGQHLLGREDFEGAREVFSAYAETWPGSSRALFFLGESHRLLGDIREAIDCYTRAQELDPGFAPAGARIRALQN